MKRFATEGYCSLGAFGRKALLGSGSGYSGVGAPLRFALPFVSGSP